MFQIGTQCDENRRSSVRLLVKGSRRGLAAPARGRFVIGRRRPDGRPDLATVVALVIQEDLGSPDNRNDVGSAECTREEVIRGAAGVHAVLSIKSAASGT